MKDCFKKGLISIVLFTGAHSLVFAATNGDALYRQGKFKEAQEAFGKAGMDHPQDARFRYNRGCAAFQAADLDAAGAAFTSVLKRTEDQEIRFRALYNSGAVAFKKGDFPSAAKHFKEALKVKPNDDDTRYNFELSLRMKTAEEDKDNQPGEEKTGDPGDVPEKGEGNDSKEDEGDDENGERKDEKGENGENSGEKGQKQNQEDLSGDLEGPEGGDDPVPPTPGPSPPADARMARNRAEALLDNVKDDRSILLEGMKRQEKQTGGSGKKW